MSGNGELRFLISDEAVEETDDIALYLALDNPEAGRRFLGAATETFEFLLQNPSAGRLYEPLCSNYPNIRQWPVRGFPNYLVFLMTVLKFCGFCIGRVI